METELTLSQAVASGDVFDHRRSEFGHCVQNFLAELAKLCGVDREAS